MYRPVTRSDILDALVHIRNLYRQNKPADERGYFAYERRELALKSLLSNLPRTKAHPTLRTVLEIANTFSLTIEGAHRLFGYDLAQVSEYDLLLNSGRTHIVESYVFDRYQLVDLPLKLASHEVFGANRMLSDLVTEWQTKIPIRALEGPGWRQQGTFYVHIGTEDSLGSSLPPGALALVEPINRDERSLPNPRAIYLLQFSNGYRCSRCVVSRGKLQLLSSERAYLGPQEFSYPGAVRIAGRIRMFALEVPAPKYPQVRSFPLCQSCASLVLPWEHQSRADLLAAKHKRFRRSKKEEQLVREHLRAVLDSGPSSRTERRYRKATQSEPHVNSLLHLTIANFARYTDSIQTGGFAITDAGRFSLETLLNTTHWTDMLTTGPEAHLPRPSWVWEAYRKEFVEWPPLLSLKFPQLSLSGDRVVRLADGNSIQGLDPSISSGSWMLLENSPAIPDTRGDQRKTGWSRPIYVLRRGLEILCGYLERDGVGYALISSPYGHGAKVVFRQEELGELRRVAGVTVSV
jgi:hypothetical protein